MFLILPVFLNWSLRFPLGMLVLKFSIATTVTLLGLLLNLFFFCLLKSESPSSVGTNVADRLACKAIAVDEDEDEDGKILPNKYTCADEGFFNFSTNFTAFGASYMCTQTHKYTEYTRCIQQTLAKRNPLFMCSQKLLIQYTRPCQNNYLC